MVPARGSSLLPHQMDLLRYPSVLEQHLRGTMSACFVKSKDSVDIRGLQY